MSSESSIKGISIRAIIVFTLVIIFGVTVFMGIDNQALNSMALTAISFYFGQKTASQTPSSGKKLE